MRSYNQAESAEWDSHRSRVERSCGGGASCLSYVPPVLMTPWLACPTSERAAAHSSALSAAWKCCALVPRPAALSDSKDGAAAGRSAAAPIARRRSSSMVGAYTPSSFRTEFLRAPTT